MFWTRSAGIVEAVWLTGIVLPGRSLVRAVPGWQSMKYSPISDCGLDSQNTSERSELKLPAPPLIWIPTSALCERMSTFSSVIFPARTPAILRSAPLTRPNALSSCTQ